MLRLLSDENFNGDIIRGLLLRCPEIDLVRVQDVGLEGKEDQFILSWAAQNNRILLTHDRATMPDFAYKIVSANEKMSGVFIVSDRLPVKRAIDELFFINECTEQKEWNNLVVYIPL